MKKSLFSLTFILFGACSIFAQKSLLMKGLVISEVDKSELIGATVHLSESEYETVTKIDGTFKLENDHPLPWKITIKYLGFLDQEVIVENLNDVHLIKMQEDPNPTNKIIVCPLPPENAFSNILKGRVIDKLNKTPLIAANVRIKGSQTVTDFDGYFELEVPLTRDLKSLIVSYEGYPNLQMPLKYISSGVIIEMDSEVKMKCIEYPTPSKKKKKRSRKFLKRKAKS